MIWSLAAVEELVVPIVAGDETAATSGQKCARPGVFRRSVPGAFWIDP